MKTKYFLACKRNLFLRYVGFLAGIISGSFGLIYLFKEELNTVILDFIGLFIAQNPNIFFQKVLFILVPISIVGIGFSMCYFVIMKLINIFQMVMNGMEDVMEKQRSQILFPHMLHDLQDMLNENARKYEQYHNEVQNDQDRKKDLIYLLTQDIKLPLSNIILYLSFINEEQRLDETLRKDYIIKILDQSLKLEEMINEFFDITRFNLQYAQLQVGEVYIDRLLAQVVDEAYQLLKEKAMSVSTQCDSFIVLQVDSEKIARVIRDILYNLTILANQGTTITIDVTTKDDGITIRYTCDAFHLQADQLAHVFHNFYRLKDLQKTNSESHILGLGVAKQIMEMHHGQIRVFSLGCQLGFVMELKEMPAKTNKRMNANKL